MCHGRQRTMQSVGVIIVNYRTAPLVIENLSALAVEKERLNSQLQVYVVDNDSRDGSVQLLSAEIASRGWADWVRLLPQTANLGFAGGNNVALANMLSNPQDCPFIFFLNPDACIQPGAVHSSRDFLLKRPEAGIVGSLLINPDGSSRRCAFRFPSPVGEFIRGAKTNMLACLLSRWDISPPLQPVQHKTDWVSGAAFMVRRNVFEQTGLMDDNFFLYYEEVDFMLRTTKLNWEIWHNPESIVMHLAGQATGIREEISQRGALPDYWYRSWRRYFVKNHGRCRAFLSGSCWLLGETIFRVKSIAQGRNIPTGGVSMTKFLRLSLVPIITRGLR